jgi:hypothetical protein
MARKLGMLWGVLFLAGGILGFVPGITTNGMFLGFFMVNPAHNILHIASGVLFLLASSIGAGLARAWFQIFGIFYIALGLIGLKVGNGLILNLISNTLIDSWGHVFLGLVLLVTGFATRK